MKQGMTIQEMAAKVQYNADHKQDYVVNMKALDFGINAEGDIEFYAGVKGYGGVGGTMTKHATRQMTTELDIPAKFVEVLKDEDPSYLPELMNRRAFTKGEDSSRMLRTIDNKMVAAVSPSFSRDYDNDTIMKAILPTIIDKGLQVQSANLSETMMFIKVVSEKQQAIAVGDFVQSGITIRNSDVGLSRAAINELIYRLVCLNGMTRSETVDAYGRIHRGARLPEGFVPSIDTTAAHQQAIAKEMRDVALYLLSDERFDRTVGLMRETKERRLTAKNLDVAVKELGKVVGYNQTEGDNILAHLIEGGDLSQYGLLNAVTRYSQDVDDYDRASDFEMMGGKILELKPRQWENIVRAQEAA